MMMLFLEENTFSLDNGTEILILLGDLRLTSK